jgi:hypothetical protein
VTLKAPVKAGREYPRAKYSGDKIFGKYSEIFGGHNTGIDKIGRLP